MRPPHADPAAGLLVAGRPERSSTAGRAALGGVALGAVSMTCTGLQLSLGPDPYEREIAAWILAGTLGWSVLAVLVVRHVVRGYLERGPALDPGALGRALGRVLLTGGAFGWLDVLTSVASTTIVAGDSLDTRMLGGAICLGPMVGAPLGMIFAGFYAWVLWAPERARIRLAFDHVDATLARVGAGLATTGAAGVALAPPHGPATEAVQWGVIAVASVALGVVLTRDLRRLRTLRRIYAGGEEAQDLLPVAPAERARELPAALDAGGPAGWAFVRRERGGIGPFRAGDLAAPLASLPESWPDARRYLTHRLLLVGYGLVVILAIVAARLGEPSLPLGLARSLPATYVPNHRPAQL